jgi:hypothetical protein
MAFKESQEVVSTSVLILSQMVGYDHEMANEDAIRSLCGIATYPLGDEALIALTRTLWASVFPDMLILVALFGLRTRRFPILCHYLFVYCLLPVQEYGSQLLMH